MADQIIVEYKLRIPEAKRFYGDVLNEFLDQAGELVETKAKENVQPGKGPGPHPHKEYPGWPTREDTANLEKSVTRYGPYELERDVKAEEIGGDGTVDYGKYLEIGWTDPRTGRFWRYPWLIPALDEQWGRIIRLLRTVGSKTVLPGVIREL